MMAQVMMCLLLASYLVRAADDDHDREVDPSWYAQQDRGGYHDPRRHNHRTHTPRPIVLLGDFSFQRPPLTPVRLSTPEPKSPDEVGSVEGMPRDLRLRNDRQLDEEDSNQAMDQLSDQLAPMLHDDTSLVGRGAGVGYYQEATIVEAGSSRVEEGGNKSSLPAVGGNSTAPSANVTATSPPSSTSTGVSREWMGMFVIVLIGLLVISIVSSLIFVCCCRQDSVQRLTQPSMVTLEQPVRQQRVIVGQETPHHWTRNEQLVTGSREQPQGQSVVVQFD